MEKVKSITEAFSMQPITIFVSEKNDYDKLRDDDVVEIKDEAIKVNGDPYDYYIGYNKDGKKIFQYRKETVNVHFFNQPTEEKED